MTIQKVFAKAKAGGWNNRNLRFDGKNWRQWDGTEEEPLVFEDELFGKVFLDPSFWQSLGKALVSTFSSAAALGATKKTPVLASFSQ